MNPEPRQPKKISEYAQACLNALANAGLGKWISLGGAFDLAHYCEFRETHDVDAWWVESPTAESRQQVTRVLENALRPFGQTRVRSWGDVASVELLREGKTVFSFQIARRSAQLADSRSSAWSGIQLDSLDDLIDPEKCWRLWQARQRLANDDADRERAKLAIHTHLERIELSRPLSQIADSRERASAKQLRAWFKKEFLHDTEN